MQHRYILLFFVWLRLGDPVDAQDSAGRADSNGVAQALHHAVSYYMTVMGKRMSIYNGTEYIFKNQGIIGHPFFLSDSLLPSEVEYSGIRYAGLPLAYDLVQDRLFTTDDSMNFYIQLSTERVTRFSIQGHRFVRMATDSAQYGRGTSGFYEVLHDGRVRVLARRTKQAEQGFKAEDPLHFVAYTDFFIVNRDVWTKVTNKKTLFQAMGDHKDLVRKFYRRNGLRYSRDPENTITRVAAFYDSK